MEGKVVEPVPIQSWTANRKMEIVLEVLQGHKIIVDVAREHDLKQSEIQQWIDTFIEFGTQALKAGPKSVEAIYQLFQRYPRYGYRRVTVMLRRRMNMVENKKKVQRIMPCNGWTVKKSPRGMRPRAQSKTSIADAPNVRWATDMTHFFCPDSGSCHVVAVIVCCIREIMGYRISRNQNANVAEGALEDALIRRFGGNTSCRQGLALRLTAPAKRYPKEKAARQLSGPMSATLRACTDTQPDLSNSVPGQVSSLLRIALTLFKHRFAKSAHWSFPSVA